MGSDLPPDLQFSVLCDDVRVENNGKFILLGLFEAIRARSFPVRHPVLYVVNRWCNGHGTFREQTRLVSARNERVIEGRENNFELKSSTSVYTVVNRFANIQFPDPGTYWIEVLLDRALRQRYPISLVEIKDGETDSKD